jgi:uncharacterized protein (TIGR03435 family)
MMTVLPAILLKVTITTSLALLCAWSARRRRAAERHLLLAAAFAMLIALPAVSALAPSIHVSLPVSAEFSAAAPFIDAPGAPVDAAPPAATSNNTAAPATRWRHLSSGDIVFGAWALGAAVFLLPIAIGSLQIRSLRRSGLPWARGRAVADALALETGVRRRVGVLLHEAVPGPMTCGVIRPVILLPMDADGWDADDLRRAVLHELAHVRRGDWASQWTARVVAGCYWFHPMVWVAWRQLSLEAERACDDAVLDRSDAAAYADQLVMLAQRLSVSSRQPQLAMASRHDLAARVIAVLDSRQQRGRAGVAWVTAACAVSALLIATVSPVRIVALAQSPAPPSSAPAAIQRYDAATIKRCEAEENPTGARGTAGGTNATFSPGRFYVPCVTTGQLIYLAYAAYGVAEGDRLINDNSGNAADAIKVRGGPAWVHSLRDKYSIEATAAGATERTVLMGSMLRTLLEERFKLKIHRDVEETPMYSLTVAKGGFKLKPMIEGDCEPLDMSAPLERTSVKPRCGMLNMDVVDGKTVWTFGGFNMRNFAGRLTSALKMHVIDNTNIKDNFVFRFEFPRDPDPLITESAILAAVQEQMGLKLEKVKAPRGFLAIDAIERPTPDAPSADAPYGRGFVEAPARAEGAGPARTGR